MLSTTSPYFPGVIMALPLRLMRLVNSPPAEEPPGIREDPRTDPESLPEIRRYLTLADTCLRTSPPRHPPLGHLALLTKNAELRNELRLLRADADEIRVKTKAIKFDSFASRMRRRAEAVRQADEHKKKP